MKIVKTIMLVWLFIAGGSSFAQQTQRGHRGPQNGHPPVPNDKQIETIVNDLADKISLSDQQKTRVFELYQEHFNLVQEKLSAARKPNKIEMDALKAYLQVKVKEKLTETQKKKYTLYLNEQHKKRHPSKRR